MELLDVLTDIATPDNSDVKGEEVEELTMPAVMQALLNVQTYPTRWTPYMELYQCQVYKAKADKKVRKMKNLIKRCALAEVMLNQQFAAALNQIEELYPDDGGRAGLNQRVEARRWRLSWPQFAGCLPSRPQTRKLKTLVRAVILFVHNQAYLSQRSVVLK